MLSAILIHHPYFTFSAINVTIKLKNILLHKIIFMTYFPHCVLILCEGFEIFMNRIAFNNPDMDKVF